MKTSRGSFLWTGRPCYGRTCSGRSSLATHLASLFALAIIASHAPANASPSTALPPALADLRGFRGRIDYTAYRDGTPGSPPIVGMLIVTARGWTLEEHTARYDLRSGADGASTLTTNGAGSIAVDDILNADPLANAWAAGLAAIATGPIEPADGNAWTASNLLVYLDATGARLVGVVDRQSQSDAAYSMDEWSTADGLDVPGRILRMRAGIPDAAFTIADYRVTRAIPDRVNTRTAGAGYVDLLRPGHPSAIMIGPDDGQLSWAKMSAAGLAAILLAALFAVAWTRRDAIILKLCRRMARDARGWKRAGTSVFVTADGVLTFDGMRYRVGPHFYGRAALVQHSALFVCVSAPGVPHHAILPRKFRPADLGVRPQRSPQRTSGFTLLETLVATALFAAVVLLAIYPSIIAIARADAMAAERSRAVVLASNALANEEAMNAYGGGAPQGTATTTQDGLTLNVSVSPGAMRGVSDLDVSVTDPAGAELAHIVSWLGAPVVSPPHSSGGPPGG